MTATDTLTKETLPPHARAIDITAETCPMTLVRTRLALDALAEGETLLVRLRGAEPLRSISTAMIDQGHDLLDSLDLDDDSVVLVIVKQGGA